jgi:hypothetical protein
VKAHKATHLDNVWADIIDCALVSREQLRDVGQQRQVLCVVAELDLSLGRRKNRGINLARLQRSGASAANCCEQPQGIRQKQAFGATVDQLLPLPRV